MTLSEKELLPVVEEFYSLQGEGHQTGEAAYFLRIGGCDIGCSFCDIKESWSAEDHPKQPLNEILDRIQNNPAQSVIVTGGEPMLYNLDLLCSELKKRQIKTSLETSGTEKLSGQWDWICVSPKRNTTIISDYYKYASELKIIVEDTSDFARAELHALNMNPKALLYLQPEWSKQHELTPLIINYILENPRWKLSIQTHKYLHIP